MVPFTKWLCFPLLPRSFKDMPEYSVIDRKVSKQGYPRAVVKKTMGGSGNLMVVFLDNLKRHDISVI